MGEGGADVRLIGGLVAGKTRIAVDPVDGLGRLGGHMVGREAAQVLVEQGDQFDHRRMDVGLKDLLAQGKPVAAVVFLQPRKKVGI